MQEIKDDMRKRANRIVSLLRSADAVANQSIMKLSDQHERLVNIQSHLLSMDTTLIDTKKSVNCLKGTTQRVIDRFRKRFHKKIRIRSRQKRGSSPQRRPLLLKPKQSKDLTPNPVTDEPIDDEVLNQFGQLILSLKEKAYIINDQLVGDADTINHIHERMIGTTDHIQQQNLDLKKILF